MDSETAKNLERFLESDIDEKLKEEVRSLIKTNPEEIIDAFHTTLTFGTGGMRGVMGQGTSRINSYTISAATQGVAEYLQGVYKKDRSLAVFIGYDSRHRSKEFAEVAACVLAGNGIKVWITNTMCPTPFVSFGCRAMRCQAAIMITASHNPKEYNGFKVYGEDGGQLIAPHDQRVMDAVKNRGAIKRATLSDPLIQGVPDAIDEEYLKAIVALQKNKKKKKLKIVYTSLHGTGTVFLPEALRRCGFENVSLVSDQCIPDGDFPTVAVPNPGEDAALKRGVKQLLDERADLLIATDPDADRVRVATREGGDVTLFDGHQMAVLALDYLLNERDVPKEGYCVKSIPTTPLFEKICKKRGVKCFNVLPGFKFIAEMIREKKESFIFGAEESYGYLHGTYARDKDAISAALLFAEMAERGSLQKRLERLYETFGAHTDSVEAITGAEGALGKEKLKGQMVALREKIPGEILGSKVVHCEDLLPEADVLILYLEDHTRLMFRPSGTEPKIKLYCSVVGDEKKAKEYINAAFSLF